MSAKYSEHEGKLHWLFGGPTQLEPRGASRPCTTCAAASGLDMIAAYFAPMGGILKRIGALAARGQARIVIAAKSDNPRPSRPRAAPTAAC